MCLPHFKAFLSCSWAPLPGREELRWEVHEVSGMALMCASGVSASPSCLGHLPRLGLSSPHLPLPAGEAWHGLGCLTGSWTSFQCCPRLPRVPRVLAALQPPLPPPVSQLRQWGCAEGLLLKHVAKKKKNQFSITTAVQFPGQSGYSVFSPKPSLVLTDPAGAHPCSHRSPTRATGTAGEHHPVPTQQQPMPHLSTLPQ